jgi:hypothetical protein
MKDDNYYSEYECTAQQYVDKILRSDATKKLIIAGPGTGKSFLFQQICRNNKDKTNKYLALSFINELVIDLAKDLYQIAEVRTLHSFALSQLPKDNKFYLHLGDIIQEDYKLINDNDISFGEILCNLIENQDALDFYSKRRKYYNRFSPNCSIYALIKYYERDKNKIPTYSQILVDEYQDFNKLEARLIDLLSERNSILIVGDDDQSLYSFKHADPNQIRIKHNSPEFNTFELPFCFRCTEVIVKGFDDIIRVAKGKGFLKDRINRKFQYLPTKSKDKLSDENPKIIIKRKVPQLAMAYHIEKEIQGIYEPKDRELSVLIICSLKKQIEKIGEMLTKKGFRNIQYPQKTETEGLIEGFDLLLKDKECNLGWRVVSKYIMAKRGPCNFRDIVKASYDNNEQLPFKDLLTKEDTKYIKSIRAILKKINENKEIAQDECNAIFECFDYKVNEIVLEKLKNSLGDMSKPKKPYKDIPIKITTILGAKGLTSSHVFLINFDDKYLLEKNAKSISDESICKFLVSLTRAKRRLYIFTNEDKLPTYVNWIEKNNIEEI